VGCYQQALELDSSDLDALEELKLSRGYALVRTRVEEELAGKCRELEGDLAAEQTAALRGYIRALRTVLEVPGILEQEITAALKEQT
jgi:hypothetical protein